MGTCTTGYFLHNRTFQVRFGNALSAVRSPENGTPQGSPLSPLLFLIAINDLPGELENIEKSLFADDCAIYKSGTNRTIRRTMKAIQESLNKIEASCNKWGFKISTSKTTCVVFNRHRGLLNAIAVPTIYGQRSEILGRHLRPTANMECPCGLRSQKMQKSPQSHEIHIRLQLGRLQEKPFNSISRLNKVSH